MGSYIIEVSVSYIYNIKTSYNSVGFFTVILLYDNNIVLASMWLLCIPVINVWNSTDFPYP